MRDETRELARLYDERYYATRLGEPCHRENPAWHVHIGRVADGIVAELAPRTFLDAGCGIGLLVEKLRERGVEAWGIEISDYALAQMPEHLRQHCWLASVTEPLPRSYDVIACIEVLEHLPAEAGTAAIANLAAHTDSILFSSSPEDFREPTHLNVQPTDYWVELFARHGFFRNLDLDAGFVAPHAIHFLRAGQTAVAVARAYERWHWRTRVELRELRAANLALVQEQQRDRSWRERLAALRWRLKR